MAAPIAPHSWMQMLRLCFSHTLNREHWLTQLLLLFPLMLCPGYQDLVVYSPCLTIHDIHSPLLLFVASLSLEVPLEQIMAILSRVSFFSGDEQASLPVNLLVPVFLKCQFLLPWEILMSLFLQHVMQNPFIPLDKGMFPQCQHQILYVACETYNELPWLDNGHCLGIKVPLKLKFLHLFSKQARFFVNDYSNNSLVLIYVVYFIWPLLVQVCHIYIRRPL